MTLIARFSVDSFEPRQVTGLEADWFSVLTFAKTFRSHRARHRDGRLGRLDGVGPDRPR